MTEKTLSPLAKQLQEEWSLSHIFTRKVDDALKQARAEVLAALIPILCRDCRDGEKVRKDSALGWAHEVKCNDGQTRTRRCGAADARQLQPAAKDLEALLRNAELKGRLEEYSHVHGNSLLGGPCCTMECRGCEHIRELERKLEKARAILEKG